MRQLLAQIGRRAVQVVDALLATQDGARLLYEDGSSIIVE